ncbi:Cas10/Cmr2 second palm domain-containing protein [Pseudoalteromonas rubra]|uniref:Cas10/Cmr2 second palm domain-containing protein n=1 Tax=Pseudoalteromonas rubra TaxID=43658 RepID=UPI000F782E22|nr:hypothetical protein [Pseudoalteromonas rubra]
MTYCYLFEARSIQHYLFRTGKLRDVVAASERLDRLIDSSEHSVLYQVLQATQLRHDLLTEHPDPDPQVRFFRCKGGAFYAYGDVLEDLHTLRSCWTLMFAQLFPGLEYCDAIAQGDSLQVAKARALAQMACQRNVPDKILPSASAVCARAQRTGALAVALDQHPRAEAEALAHTVPALIDLSTQGHRYAFRHWKLNDEKGSLHERFTPDDLPHPIRFPVDLEDNSVFFAVPEGAEPSKDIALIHLDGNGLGQLMMALDDSLTQANASSLEYASAFRAFSEQLTEATIAAAKQATAELVEVILAESPKLYNGKLHVPMRPLVLGGDDLTLFCRADLALPYSEAFCRAFKKASEASLADTLQLLNKNTDIKPYLTASGGVLVQKATHPFTQSHELVESLCKQAKQLTKQIDANVGPAALSFIQVSNPVTEPLEGLVKRYLQHELTQGTLTTSLRAYLVEPRGHYPSLSALRELHWTMNQENTPMTIGKWRHVLTLLAANDWSEAEDLIIRDLSLCKSKAARNQLVSAFQSLAEQPCGEQPEHKVWHWQSKLAGWATPLSDLLVLSKIDRLSAAEGASQAQADGQSTRTEAL